MPTLNFPTNPSLNQLYSFEGKTWIWTGQAWRLDPQGAINGIVIGNTTPAAGTFTTLTANTLTVNNETVYANLAVGNLAVSNVSVAGNVNSALNVRGNVTGTNVITGGSVSASGNIGTLEQISALGNITTSAYFIGDGSRLSNIAAGSQIVQGNSNVVVQGAGGNVTVGVRGVANVAVFTPTGIRTSNVSATGNVSGNYFIGNGSQLTGIVTSGGSSINYGNSNVSISGANANVTVGVNSASNVAVFSPGQLSVAGNVVANNFIGNITGNIVVAGANAGVLFNNDGVIGSDAGFTFESANANLSVAGNVVANTFIGDGSQLANVMADRGSDQPNWDTITQMGTYTVNRDSWSGTTGTPLDSQVYVGLLEVKNSTNTALEQVFYPGTVDLTDAKVQWNRNFWNGSWTIWIKIINDYQVMQGGEF